MIDKDHFAPLSQSDRTQTFYLCGYLFKTDMAYLLCKLTYDGLAPV